MRRVVLGLMAACVVAVSVSAQAVPLREDARLTQGPPPRDIQSPYEPALRCLATQITDEQRRYVFAPGDFPDQTSRFNYVADSGVGSISPQSVESMLFSSLAMAGVRLTDMTPASRQRTDWAMARVGADQRTLREASNGNVNVPLELPDIEIRGAITTLDFVPGGGGEVNIAGVRLGHRQSRILVGIDARAVIAARPNAVPGEGLDGRGGLVLAVTRMQKQIVGYDLGGGGTGFVGSRTSPWYVSVDIGERPREPIQFAVRFMIDRVAFVLLSDVYRISSCDEQLRWGDEVTNLQNME